MEENFLIELGKLPDKERQEYVNKLNKIFISFDKASKKLENINSELYKLSLDYIKIRLDILLKTNIDKSEKNIIKNSNIQYAIYDFKYDLEDKNITFQLEKDDLYTIFYRYFDSYCSQLMLYMDHIGEFWRKDCQPIYLHY